MKWECSENTVGEVGKYREHWERDGNIPRTLWVRWKYSENAGGEVGISRDTWGKVGISK